MTQAQSTQNINGLVAVGETLQQGTVVSPDIPNRVRIEHVGADRAVLAADSGKVFIADAAVNFTLPTVALAAGCHWLFINGADTNMTITATPSDTLVVFNDVAADSIAFSTSSEKVGNAVRVICDGTKHYAMVMLGTETATPTIAT